MINENSNKQKEILGKRQVRLDDSSFVKEGKHRYETVPLKLQQKQSSFPARQTKLDDQLQKLRKDLNEMSYEEDIESDLQYSQQHLSKFIQLEGRNSNTQSEHFDKSQNFSNSFQNDISGGKLISSNIIKSGILNKSWTAVNQNSTFTIKDDDEDYEMEDFENFNWDDQIQEHIVKMMGTSNPISKGSLTVQECLKYLQSQKLQKIKEQKQI